MTVSLTEADVLDLRGDLTTALHQVEVLTESLADVELAMEDRGWTTIAMNAAQDFSRGGRRTAASLCRILSVQNPLVKRGLAVRAGYVWGDGVQIAAAHEDVNEVLTGFLEANEASYSGIQARVESEGLLGTDGDIFRALPTQPLTGSVTVRSIDPSEISEIITNPEDRDEPWFYLREFDTVVLEAGFTGSTRRRKETRRVLYPALGFRPNVRPKSIDGIPVQWDSPVQHLAVNRIDGWSFGIGDAYAAIFFARAYNEFLSDWAGLTKALSRFAWRLTAKRKGTAQKAATEAQRAANAIPPLGGQPPVGGIAASNDAHLEAIPKTGATIDAESGRPLAGMVAAALGVPVTILLSDPGQTGARAVAETLDEPTKNEMLLRRSIHESADRALFRYVIEQSVKAPRGALRGRIRIDERGREVVELGDEYDMAIEFSWPSLDKIAVDVIVKAIVDADGTDKVPAEVIARLLLAALGVDDIDKVLEDYLDEDGRWIDPDINAGDAAVKRQRDGEDPAGTL